MSAPFELSALGRCAVVGQGRMGSALATALPLLEGPFGHGFDGTGFDGTGFDVVVLAVPDDQIREAAEIIRSEALVGHCAGSLGVDVLAPREAFALHPLMTVTRDGAVFAGAGAAVAGSTPRALGVAQALAASLGLEAVEIADRDRVAYHAAASIASNFLTTIEDAAETMLETTGAERRILIPLVRAAVENWARLGVEASLTGPISRGDEATVARQRMAVSERAPELLALFDVLCDRTRTIAGRQPG